MTKRKTQEQYIEEASDKHSGRYDYSEVVYKNNKSLITVICKVHGGFLIAANHHLHRGQGCPSCVGKRLNTSESVARAKKAHGDKYSYERYEYIDCYHLATVTCPIHGDWKVSHNEHVNSSSGCPKCVGKGASTQSFVEASDNRHRGLYTYESTLYKNNYTKVEVTCRTHGPFRIRPYDHIAGGGCPKCTKHGYCSGLPGYIYVMKCDEITKIGITNKDVQIRAKKISKSAGKTFSVLTYIKFLDGSVAQDIETVLLKELRALHAPTSEVFDGSTECFVGIDYTTLLARITEVASNRLNTPLTI